MNERIVVRGVVDAESSERESPKDASQAHHGRENGQRPAYGQPRDGERCMR